MSVKDLLAASKAVVPVGDKKSNLEIMLSKMLGIDLTEMKNIIGGLQNDIVTTIDNQNAILQNQADMVAKQDEILAILKGKEKT